jgi:hypothetical protein
MKSLPDLQDIEAMAARGRRSTLMSARNEALETLRDGVTHLQSCDIGELHQLTGHVIDAAKRLEDISKLWNEQ